MDIFLVVLGAALIIVGILGSILPVLPGPPIAWVGILLLNLTSYADFSITFMIVTAIITTVLVVMDYVMPIWTTKKFGGSKASERGAIIGALIGIFLGPFGIIIGPFIGAFVGEYWLRPDDTKHSLKVAFGSFVGFILNTGLKLIWCVLLAYWFVQALV